MSIYNAPFLDLCSFSAQCLCLSASACSTACWSSCPACFWLSSGCSHPAQSFQNIFLQSQTRCLLSLQCSWLRRYAEERFELLFALALSQLSFRECDFANTWECFVVVKMCRVAEFVLRELALFF